MVLWRDNMSLVLCHAVSCYGKCAAAVVCCAVQDHLSVYSLMDISLDTFPYSGRWSDGCWVGPQGS